MVQTLGIRVDSLNKQSFKNASQASDCELIDSFRKGELESFNQLILRYQPVVTGLAFRFLDNKDDALEVCQETFMRAYDKLDSLKETQYFKTWLLRIASNQAINKRNSRKVRQAKSLDQLCYSDDYETSIELEGKSPSPEENLLQGELQCKISRILAELPEIQSQCLIMFCLEKIPQAQVAEILDLKIQTVKWHIFQARKTLKYKLSDYL